MYVRAMHELPRRSKQVVRTAGVRCRREVGGRRGVGVGGA